MTLEEAIRARRSVRRFTAEPAPQKTLLRLLELACWVPHGADRGVFLSGARGGDGGARPSGR